jgi:lysozyme
VNLSSNGAAFIGAFEGFRDQCYNDAVGNCTIGYGHLVHAGPTTAADRAKWGTITRSRGLELLQVDAAHCVTAVHDQIHIPLTQGQFDALVSLAYNCGPGVIAGVAAIVNAKPRYARRNQLPEWRQRVKATLLTYDHAGGVELTALKRRRQAEGVLFTTGHYTQAEGNPYANA